MDEVPDSRRQTGLKDEDVFLLILILCLVILLYQIRPRGRVVPHPDTAIYLDPHEQYETWLAQPRETQLVTVRRRHSRVITDSGDSDSYDLSVASGKRVVDTVVSILKVCIYSVYNLYM